MTSDELKTLRQSLRLSQSELAMVLEVETNTVSRWEMPSNAGRYPVPKWVAREVNRMTAEDALAKKVLDKDPEGA